ncbi:MAG: hypothetical protein RIS75_515 [Actinomycetota bacterium]
MNFGQSIATCYKKYFVFSGRARLSEYWWFALFSGILAIPAFIFSLAMVLTMNMYLVMFPWVIFFFAVGIPAIAVSVRRLHDMGQSGIWVYLSYGLQIMVLLIGPAESSDAIDNIPAIIGNIVGGILSIAVFVMTLIPSQQKENKYGPIPALNTAPIDSATPPPPPSGYTPLS